MPEPGVAALLVLASLLAGFIDAVAGGGGLILFPALLLGLPPQTPIPTILGTNKLAACAGTTVAFAEFARARLVNAVDLVPPMLAAMLGAAIGAHFAYRLDPGLMRPIMQGLLVAMLLFILLKPELGKTHAPKLSRRVERIAAASIALALGFYDGFFGPGTGSLLIFMFVTVLGFDFVRASALAKAANWGSNVAALTLFVLGGSYLLGLALTLAAANIVGARLGVRLAVKKGSRLVRLVFVVVVSGLVLRLFWQTFF